jgi:hypothetical protein
MGWLTQLYAGCILLVVVIDPDTATHADLTALSLEEFRIGIERGVLRPGTPTTTHAYAKIVLGSFLDGLATPEFDDARRVAAGG